VGLCGQLFGAQLEGGDHLGAAFFCILETVGEKHDLADESVVGDLGRGKAGEIMMRLSEYFEVKMADRVLKNIIDN
jgi:hypothetical protein